MSSEVDRCIDWCMSKGKLVFTAQRFGNWCANKVKWDKEEERKKQEMMAQKNIKHSYVGQAAYETLDGRGGGT